MQDITVQFHYFYKVSNNYNTFDVTVTILFQVGLGIIELFKPERNTSLGVLALLCSPAEGASNLLLLLAEGDLTFSATVTSVNNFATVGKIMSTNGTLEFSLNCLNEFSDKNLCH